MAAASAACDTRHAAGSAAAAHQPLRIAAGAQPGALGKTRACRRDQIPDLDRRKPAAPGRVPRFARRQAGAEVRRPVPHPKPTASTSPAMPSKRARSKRLPVPAGNILQLLPDAVVPSRDKLAAYWRTVADDALLYLGRRPLKLVRRVKGTTF